MRNVKVENGELSYDCDAEDCATPGVPHRVTIREVMAGLESAVRESLHFNDPRAEVLLLAVQYVYQQLFHRDDPFPTSPDSLWAKEFQKVVEELEEFYDTAPAESKEKKKLLN